MKTYSVWIEVEEYDSEKDEYRDCEGLSGAAVATFKTENAAFAFAELLQDTGESWRTRERKQRGIRQQSRAAKAAR